MAIRVAERPSGLPIDAGTPNLVEARGVHRVYDTGEVSVHALDDVNLAIPPVRAEVVNLSAFSVHACRSELTAWANGETVDRAPDTITWCTANRRRARRTDIGSRCDTPVVAPRHGERVRLG